MPIKVIDTERFPIKMWLDDIEVVTMGQAKNLANLPFVHQWVSIMPDAHSGYGMPIGGVLAVNDDVILPNAIGKDISCGMCAVRTSLTDIDEPTLKSIMGKIRRVIPVGFSHQNEDQPWDGFDLAPDVPIVQQQLKAARKQLGTLGGGNHFIEIQKGDDGFIWLMLHSGSRNIGLKVADEYHYIAQHLCTKWYSGVLDDLAFLPLDTIEGRQYYDAMLFCTRFAFENRALMMKRLADIVKEETSATEEDEINISHNYASLEEHYGKKVLVHRKGATSAFLGQRGIIPGSMGSSSYIVKGLGNPESFMSCSHGAGRRLSRSAARRELHLEEEQQKMSGVVHGLRSVYELEEAPGAYKDIDAVMENQKDLVEIQVKLKPLASIKG